MKRVTVLLLLLGLAQTACVVGGYSSRGGWFLWPGGLFGVLAVIAVLFLLSRRRR